MAEKAYSNADIVTCDSLKLQKTGYYYLGGKEKEK